MPPEFCFVIFSIDFDGTPIQPEAFTISPVEILPLASACFNVGEWYYNGQLTTPTSIHYYFEKPEPASIILSSDGQQNCLIFKVSNNPVQ